VYVCVYVCVCGRVPLLLSMGLGSGKAVSTFFISV